LAKPRDQELRGCWRNIAFRYRETARQEPGFHALDGYPNFDCIYESQTLPAFFANRVMSRHRESFPEYLVWLGLEGAEELPTLPLEVLATTGGPRVTDTFHIVDGLDQGAGVIDTRFFVSGIRHCPGAAECVQQLHVGDSLKVIRDFANTRNHLALQLDTARNVQIGWIPDWMLTYVHPFVENGTVSVTVERINEDAPEHLMVLCRIRGNLKYR